MAEYSAAEHFSNSNRQQRVPVVEFTLSSDIAPRSQNVVHKTTSETLRLTDPQTAAATGDVKKTSSFQITSVTVSSSISNDGEDDSCGEVDDSQTEQSDVGGSQNQIDVETYQDSPVVTNVVPVSLAQQVSEVGFKLEDKDQLKLRFRVVKIESSEPFKRGRWLCMDFLDQPSSVQPSLPKEEPGSGASSSGSLSEQIVVGEDSHIPNPTVQAAGAVLNAAQQASSSIQVVVPHSLPASAASINFQPAGQQQLLQQQPVYQQSPPIVYPAAAAPPPILQQPAVASSNPASLAIPLTTPTCNTVVAGQQQPALSSNVGQQFVQQPVQPGLLPQQQQQQQPSIAIQQPAYVVPPVAQQQPVVAIPQPAFSVPSVVQQQPQQHQQPQQQQHQQPQQQPVVTITQPAYSAPTVVQPQQQQQQQPVVAIPQPAYSVPPVIQQQQSVTIPQPVYSAAPVVQPQQQYVNPAPTIQPGINSQQQHIPVQQQQQVISQVPASTNLPIQPPGLTAQQHIPAQQQQIIQQPQQVIQQPQQQQVIQQPQQVIPQIPVLAQQPGLVIPPGSTSNVQSAPTALVQPPSSIPVVHSAAPIVPVHIQQNPPIQQQHAGTFEAQHPPPDVVQHVQQHVQQPAYNAAAVIQQMTTLSQPPGTAELQHHPGGLMKSHSVAADDNHASEEHASASGSSTVAIDNKIEQAMDLVKSHLMFAVREEVEVLKERIDVLMERIAYLEAENQILRAAANQDTLAQIAQLEATSPGSGIDNNNSSSSSGTAPNQNTSSSNGPAPAAGNQPERSTTSQLPNGTSPAP